MFVESYFWETNYHFRVESSDRIVITIQFSNAGTKLNFLAVVDKNMRVHEERSGSLTVHLSQNVHNWKIYMLFRLFFFELWLRHKWFLRT